MDKVRRNKTAKYVNAIMNCKARVKTIAIMDVARTGQFQVLSKSCLRGGQNGLPISCLFLASGGVKIACPNLAHFLPQGVPKCLPKVCPFLACARSAQARTGQDSSKHFWDPPEARNGQDLGKPFCPPLRQEIGKKWASHFDLP